MATNAGTLFVELQAKIGKFKKNLNSAQGQMKSFANKTKNFVANNKLLIAGALAGLGAGVAKTIKAYGVQEQAIAKLTQALKNQGITTQSAIDEQTQYAAALQQVTTYGDEEIIGLQGLLAQYGATGQALKDTTKMTLDLAAAKGIDLRAAADLVGKAFVGETGTLSRYGIIIEKGLDRTEKFAAVQEKMQQMFGGQAEAQRETTLGQFKSMNNAFGDLQETIGSLVAGEGNSLVVMMTGWIQKVDSSLQLIRDTTREFGNFGTVIKMVAIESLRTIGDSLITFISHLTVLGPIMRRIGIDIEGIREKMHDQIDTWQASIQVTKKESTEHQKAEQTKREAVIETNAVIVEEEKKTAEAKKEIKEQEKAELEEHYSFRKDLDDKAKEASILNAQAWGEVVFSTIDQISSQFGQGVADMVMEGRRFSDVVKQIWKDLARAVIAEISRMIAKWLMFMALRAATGGAGGFGGFMAEGGIISEPSVITGLKSGVSHIAGEAGPEVVMPMQSLKSARHNKAMDTAGLNQDTGTQEGSSAGGMSVTVNITGTFLEGSESKWQRMVRDVLVPELRRRTMIDPQGLFNRRRGASV